MNEYLKKIDAIPIKYIKFFFAVIVVLLIHTVRESFFADEKKTSSSSDKPSTVSSPEARKAVSPSRKSPNVGEIAIIGNKKGELFPAALTESKLKEAIKLNSAKDNYGLALMMAAGDYFGIESGTKALVIDTGIFTCEIRITEGIHAGKRCFLPSDFVYKE